MNEQNQQFNRASQTQPNVPPPPPGGPEAKMRTMASDVKSVRESGGGVPEPQVIKPEELSGEKTSVVPPSGAYSPSPAAPAPPPPPSTAVPPSNVPPAIPAASTAPVASGGEKKKWGWIWWLIGAVAVIVALGVGGWWFYVHYYQSSAPAEEEAAPQQLATSTISSPPPVPPQTSQSFFNLPDKEVALVDVDGYKVVNILAGLQNAASSLTDDGQMREAALRVNGQPAQFSLFLTTTLPELERTNLEAVLGTEFENNFGILLYRQSGEVWPVYAVRKKASAAAEAGSLSDHLLAIEEASVGNLYLKPPLGEAVFRLGPVGDKYSSRYASFENKPASFNYGVFGDYLILSTTYQGLAKTIELLGL